MNRCEWILIGSSGEADAEPHEFLGSFDGKPEAYRYVLRQSRLLILKFPKSAAEPKGQAGRSTPL